MCVVEKDIWCYPVGDGHELRGDDMPNPCQPVKELPWGAWRVPWQRDQPEDEGYDMECELERLAFWLFCVGMMLWEIEEGLHHPTDIAAYPPEPAWLEWALRWVREADPGKPPPLHHHRKRAAWMRRQQGVLRLEAGLRGLHDGLVLVRQRARIEQARPAAVEPAIWS